MNIFTVSFFGHRVTEDPVPVQRRLEALIRGLLTQKEYVEFLVGRDGAFDQLVSSAIRRCQRKYGCRNSAHVWVLPYPTAELRDQEEALRQYYDEIELCGACAGAHFKGAHQIRNREMVDRSHLVVFCVRHEGGDAWQTMEYARKKGVPCINISGSTEEALWT